MSKTDLNTANESNIDSTYLRSLRTTSSKIRYLDSLGCTRTEISKILYVRYQHVRNVLEMPVKTQRI